MLKEAEWKRENDIRTFINEAPEEAEQPKEYRYEYKLGDTVYIGADEYSILSLEDTVVLSDSKFPLFTKEFSKSDFEKKVKEISSSVMEEFFKILWQRKSFWKDSVKR